VEVVEIDVQVMPNQEVLEVVDHVMLLNQHLDQVQEILHQ
jgi:hypothetical protein